MSDGGETETVEKFLLLEKLKKKRTSVKRRVTQAIKEIDEAVQCNERQSLEDHIKEYISEEDYETLIYWRGIKLMNLCFPQCKKNSGEKGKVSKVKSQTETHFGETYRAT